MTGISSPALWSFLEMQLFPQNPLPALHRTTELQIITGNYRLTTAHYRQITGIFMVFTIRDVYRYRRFTDQAGLFTADFFLNNLVRTF